MKEKAERPLLTCLRQSEHTYIHTKKSTRHFWHLFYPFAKKDFKCCFFLSFFCSSTVLPLLGFIFFPDFLLRIRSLLDFLCFSLMFLFFFFSSVLMLRFICGTNVSVVFARMCRHENLFQCENKNKLLLNSHRLVNSLICSSAQLKPG